MQGLQSFMLLNRASLFPSHQPYKYAPYMQSLCLPPDSSPCPPFSSPSPLMLLQQQASGTTDQGTPPFFGVSRSHLEQVDHSPLSPGAFRPLPSSDSPSSFPTQIHSSMDQTERLTPLSDISSSSMDRSTPEDPTQRLRRKRRTCLSSVGSQCSCPVCGVTVRPHELEAHFQQEAGMLTKIPKQVSRHNKDHNHQSHTSSSSNRQQQRSTSPSNGSPGCSSTSGPSRKDSPDLKTSPAARLQLFERIKSNRNERLSARASRSGDKNCKEALCPVCQRRLFGTPAQLNAHAEACLRKRGSGFSEDEDVDVEGETSSAQQQQIEEEDVLEDDEYLWAGQTRLRATSLLEGGYAGCGFTTVRASNEDDEDLNVDGDDTATYGQPQYCESDVILCGSGTASNEDRTLRRALSLRPGPSGDTTGTDPSADESRLRPPTEEASNDVEDEQSQDNGDGTTIANGSSEAEPSSEDNSYSAAAGEAMREGTLQTRPSDQRQIVAALHQQIVELRGSQSGMLKCLICMDLYKKPVVSVGCWHVYCEECWLRTLGAKKLCPQCNTITSAGDLRKIYM